MTVLSQVKSLTGRSFDATNKLWRAPNNPENLAKLKSFGFAIEGGTPEEPKAPVVIKRLPEPQKEFNTSVLSILPYSLRPYQTQASQFFEANNWNGLLSLGMRMGKTIVSLVGTLIHTDMLPCLIITTATGKGVWWDEIKFWLKKKAFVLQGTTPYSIPKDTQYVIINYTILDKWVDVLQAKQFKYIICDEFHNINNTKLTVNKTKEEYEIEKARNDLKGKPTKKQKTIPVKCTSAFLQLAEGCPHVVGLSGTPMTTCPRQLRVPLSLYVPSFKNEYWFLNRFCNPTMGTYGWLYEGLSNEQELFPILDKWVFRRTKQDIWEDLPEEQHQMIPVPVDKELYEREINTLKRELRNAHLSDDEVEERLAKFQSLSFSSKQNAIFTFIQEYLETGNKLVVFAWHRVAMEALHAKFKKHSVMVYGGTNPKDRASFIKQFNEDPNTTLAILQIKSCAEAITLKADTIAYAELSPTPGLLQQSAERIWQAETGQTKLFYYYFIAEDTVDAKRVVSLRNRAKLLSQVLDKKDGVLFGESLSDIVDEA